MTFAEFQSVREKLLREKSDIVDCAATNLYAALAHRIPPATPVPEYTVHRCHLASEWVERFGLPGSDSRRALISRGVRDSLALLFSYFARQDTVLWLPEDSYPVYGELARSAGLSPNEFPTLPAPSWPEHAPVDMPEILLITNPLKPLGRWLTEGEVDALAGWLSASSQRRLILDAVYTFETSFHATTQRLLAMGQTILLHSLTKGWLQPKLFGIALVPNRDIEALTPLFRAHAPPQIHLARAREMLGTYCGIPATIAMDLIMARDRMDRKISKECARVTEPNSAGYFTPVFARWEELLVNQNLLGIPATVFGSRRDDLTILSSLSFLQ